MRRALEGIHELASSDDAQVTPYVTLAKIESVTCAALADKEKNMPKTCEGCLWLNIRHDPDMLTQNPKPPQWSCTEAPGGLRGLDVGAAACESYQPGGVGGTLDIRTETEGQAKTDHGVEFGPADVKVTAEEKAVLECDRAPDDPVEREEDEDFPMAVLQGALDSIRVLRQRATDLDRTLQRQATLKAEQINDLAKRVAGLEERSLARAQDVKILGKELHGIKDMTNHLADDEVRSRVADLEKRLGTRGQQLIATAQVKAVEVWASVQFEAFHCWPKAVEVLGEKHRYLATRHRHVFHVRAFKPVTHSDRDVEFIQFKRELQEWCRRRAHDERAVAEGIDASGSVTTRSDGGPTTTWEHPGVKIGTWSCEQWAAEIMLEFKCSKVEVSEDGENGAVLVNQILTGPAANASR